jgi:hypothetical protein
VNRKRASFGAFGSETVARRKRVSAGMLLTASSFVYQIHLSPLRSRSLVGAPIHFAVQSDCWSRPVSRLAGAL